LGGERKNPENDKSHVAHGRVGDKPFDVGLDNGNGRAIHDTDDAKDRVTDTGLPYILFDTTLISDDLAGLIDGAIDNPIDLDAFAGLTATAVWTGTATDGMGTVTHCGNWTDDTGGLSGTIGSSTRSTANWTINGSASCNASAFHLYCFQR